MKEAVTSLGLPHVRVPATLWEGLTVDELEAVELPERWVLKPNHRSNAVYLGEGRPNIKELARITKSWHENVQFARFGEWAYGSADRLLLVEEWVGDRESVPLDFKVLVFDGKPALLQVDVGRFAKHRRRLYRTDWTPLAVTLRVPLAEVQPKPQELETLLSAASAIASDFDFMRVDFFVTNGVVWFGEVTPYPGGGLSRFSPDWLDFELGRCWRQRLS
jgi:hypothetical protein